MDNNNGGIDNLQNMQPNSQSNMSGVPNMNGPMNSGGQMNQNVNQMGPNMGQMNQMNPNMGQNVNQPYPQQMMQPQKRPMDPAKKKRIILIVSIVFGLLVVGIVLAIVLPIVLRVDYSTAYNTVKELRPEIYDIYQSYDCEYVVDYVESTYTSIKTYDGYVQGCKDVYSSGADELVDKLENTDGVKRNEEIGKQFGKFKNEYVKVSSGDIDELSSKLALWQAKHSFEVAADDLSYGNSSDSDFTAAANYLINSNNDALKTYGEGWLERQLVVAANYRAYNNSSWTNYSDYQALRDTYNNSSKEIKDWIAANEPDINTIAPLNFGSTKAMYSEFNSLYNLISENYALNYNSGSGDCDEIFGVVYCE